MNIMKPSWSNNLKFVQPPIFESNNTGVQGVYLQPNEDVNWNIFVNPDGTRKVLGYTIIRKIPEIFQCSACPLDHCTIQ